jgi:phosphatidate cytidylyltransferase
MAYRLLSTLGLWGVLLFALKWGGLGVGVWGVAVFSFLTQREVNRLLQNLGYGVPEALLLFVAFSFPLVVWYIPRCSPEWIGLYTVVLGLSGLRKNPKDQAGEHLVCMGSLFSFLYVPFNFHFLILMAKDLLIFGEKVGMGGMVWLTATAKFSDVGGFLTGSLVGKHPLALSISPSKTWEGVGGGLLTSALVSATLAYVCPTFLPPSLTPLRAAILSLPIALVATASDLLESQFKRLAKVKDSGRIIPGIGGVLDLTDSLLLTFPVGFLLCRYVIL